MSAQQDGSGPYIRFEVTIAAAIVKRDDTILNDDMLDTTLVFGRPLADGPAIDAGLVTTERSQAAIAQVLADLAQAVQVFINQHYAFLGALEGEGRGMIDDIRETGETREVIGTAAFRTVSGKGARA